MDANNNYVGTGGDLCTDASCQGMTIVICVGYTFDMRDVVQALGSKGFNVEVRKPQLLQNSKPVSGFSRYCFDVSSPYISPA